MRAVWWTKLHSLKFIWCSPNLQHLRVWLYLETKLLKRHLRVNEVTKVGPLPSVPGVYKKRKEHWGADRGKTTWRGSQRAAVYEPRREASEETTLLAPWSWTCSLQTHEEIRSCHVSHSCVVFCCGSPREMQEGTSRKAKLVSKRLEEIEPYGQW